MSSDSAAGPPDVQLDDMTSLLPFKPIYLIALPSDVKHFLQIFFVARRAAEALSKVLSDNLWGASMSSGSRRALLALLSGLMWAASFPPLPLGFLAYFMLIPLWSALEEAKSLKQAGVVGYLWGFVATLGTLWWIYIPTVAGLVALSLFLPLYGALYAALHHTIARRSKDLAVLVAPVLLVAVEFVRSWGRLGFPWMNLAYTQTGYTLFIQFAELFGSFGVSFWVVAINVCFYFLLRRPLPRLWWLSVFALVLLFGGAAIYGIYSLRREFDGKPLDVALLQGNVDPYKKWTRSFRRKNAKLYADMLRSVDGKADLCILPETATACYHRLRPSMFSPIVEAVMDIKTPTLTGTLDFDDRDRRKYFNSAILIMPDGSYDQRYDKIQLVPFSEQVPLQETFPWLRRLNFGGSHFTRGESFTVFEFDSVRFSVLICYESIFGWLGRRFRNAGAQFLVNITNDGWFGRTSGPFQHAMFNVMRAIENRCWIARCANTGVSMFVDPYGRVVRKTGIFTKAILTGRIFATDHKTLYDRIGDVVGWAALAATPIIILLVKPTGQDRREGCA